MNDIHSGSDFAVKSPWATRREIQDDDPDDGPTFETVHSAQSPRQKILFEYWEMLAKKWKRPDILVVNGDLIEGLQKRAHITRCWSDNLQDQADDSMRLIKMFDAKKIFVIRGTEYHTGSAGNDIEENIAKELNAVKVGQKYSSYFRLINLAPEGSPEKIIHFTHHIQGSKFMHYRGMPLSRAMANMMLNEGHWVDRQKFRSIFGIVRAHVHYYWYEESASRMMLQAPAWQLQTPYGFKVNPESPPDIGAVKFTFYSNGKWDKEHQLLKTKLTMPKVYS